MDAAGMNAKQGFSTHAVGTPANPYLAYPGFPGCTVPPSVRDSGYGDCAGGEGEGGPSKLGCGGGGAVDGGVPGVGTRRDHAPVTISATKSKSRARAEHLGHGSVSFLTDLMCCSDF